MYFVLAVAVLMCVTNAQVLPTTISATNGQVWGTWGTEELCNPGFYATGFSLLVEQDQNTEDDTALNGIKLFCTLPITAGVAPVINSEITSAVGYYGDWTAPLWCSKGMLRLFQLRVQPYQGTLDDSAANNIRFKSTGNKVLEGSGLTMGTWGSWSQSCSVGICGIQTQIESWHNLDVTSLNNVKFRCCA